MNNVIIYPIFLLGIFVFAQIHYKVKPGDTIYSISKKHNIDIQKIYKINPKIKCNSLIINKIILIPNKNSSIKEKFLSHKVQSGETFYSISKKYNINIKNLIKQNPNISENLKQGDILYISMEDSKKDLNIKEIPSKKIIDDQIKKENLPNEILDTFSINKNDFIIYLVKEEDTIFNIMYNYNIDLKTLLEYNPTLNKGLISGMQIKIPINNNTTNNISGLNDFNKSNNFIGLTNFRKLDNSIILNNFVKNNNIEHNKNKNIINILLFFPFSNKKDKYSKFNQNSINFYLGTRAAINFISQKQKIYVKILNIQDHKKIDKLLNTYNFSSIDAVIGPFLRSNIEKIAEKLEKKKHSYYCSIKFF